MSNAEVLLNAPQISEQVEIPQTALPIETLTRGRQLVGRAALIIGLAMGPGVIGGIGESIIDAHPAGATTTFANDYPDGDAADCSAQFGAYSWCKDTSGDGHYQTSEQYSSRLYGYRNCTDGVAYWIKKYTGVTLPSNLGNATSWDTNAPSSYSLYDGTTNNIEPGDIAQGDLGAGGLGHVGMVISVTKDSTGAVTSFQAAELNAAGTGYESEPTYSARNADGKFARGAYEWDHFIDVNGANKGLNNEAWGNTTPTPVHLSRMLFARGDDTLFAKDNPLDGWSQETGGGWLRNNSNTQIGTIAVGGADGTTQLWINSCDALYAKGSLGTDGWTQEAACGTAKSVSVSNTNLQMMVDDSGAVWAKYGIGVGGWNYEAAAGTAATVAAGGDTQMMLGTCGAVYAKNGVGYGGWTEEAPCGTATQIAISSTGLQMILNACGGFYSKYGVGVGGWWAEGDCGWAKQVAAGGDTHMFLSTNGAVYAKTSMGYGGWTSEAGNGTATAIAIGSSGRQIIQASDSSIWSKDSISVGGWTQIVSPGNSKAIAVS